MSGREYVCSGSEEKSVMAPVGSTERMPSMAPTAAVEFPIIT
jgi:hypothetical protein